MKEEVQEERARGESTSNFKEEMCAFQIVLSPSKYQLHFLKVRVSELRSRREKRAGMAEWRLIQRHLSLLYNAAMPPVNKVVNMHRF